jgi:oligopeptide transport system substrate-binding protein
VKKFSIFFLILAATACTRDSHPDYYGTIVPKHAANELWINGGNEPQYLDPNKINGNPEINICTNLFVRLTQTNPKTGEIIPDLAERWDISADGREYTFHLRKDAKWSDGQAITARDVEYSWKRLIDPKTGSVSGSLADVIENAYAFRTGKKPMNSVSVKALDNHTLWVRLVSPIGYFLGLIEYTAFSPLPTHLIEKLKADGKEDQWTRPENIVVSGAYTLVEDHFKQHKVFKKNPKYYRADKVRIEKIRSLIIESYNSDMNAYRTGQHDWSCCNSLPPEQMDFVKSKKDFHVDPYLATYFLMMNTSKKPLDNPLVRKALSLAIDRKAIVDNIVRGGQTPSRDFVPAGTAGYPGINSVVFDVAEAKKLLAQAGYPDGKDFPKVAFKFNTSEVHKLVAEAIQQMWKNNLGVNIELLNEEWSVFMESQKSGNFQILRRAWIGDFVDPFSFLNVLQSNGSNNKSGWKNKTYDQLMEASNLESDKQKRFEIFKKAEAILAEEQPYLPLFSYTRSYMKKPFLRGFWPHFQDRHEWKYMWIDTNWEKNTQPDEPWL